ncbi:DUF202 domain-containing protein [Ruegeria sediminis]|uniref:DUF202 domain-containing protein n=1 Tax=Ruegeria sediminis TaxID=2583820 RepID=A0ABY2WZN4_9RHOB|nr:DUF202 domain-containing protein [Ruegeria sediminis]TMV08456.1 DUF202 domain-containing protein [Ruegeria sediminis]
MVLNFTDHASNERTFLAWVRTAIAIMGFGIGIERLVTKNVAIWSEVLLLGAGAVVILLAYVRMRHLRGMILRSEMIDQEATPSETLLLLLVASLIALLGVFVFHIS